MKELNSSPHESLLSPRGGEGEAADGERSPRVSSGDASGLERQSSAIPSPKEKEKEKFKSALERGHWMARRVARRGYLKSKQFVAHQYTLFKQDAKRGHKIIRWLSIISCFLLIPGIFLDLLTLALTLSPAEFLANVYCLLGALLIIAAEFARQSPRFGVRSMLHYYLRFVELSAGRGVVQLFVASFCVSIRYALNLFKFIPGLILLLCGCINLIWGTYAACKLNAMLARLRDAEGADKQEDEEEEGLKPEEDEERGEKHKRKSLTEQLDLMERKFEALDRRGDGVLTKEDLKEAAAEMNLLLNEEEIETVFDSLDTDKDGKIDKDEFERWWLSNKGVKLL